MGMNQELVAHIYNPSYLGNRDQEDSSFMPAWAKIPHTLSQKYPTQKQAGGVTPAVEYLPSESEALSSNSSATKKGRGECSKADQ
jgi:hypothetical protein